MPPDSFGELTEPLSAPVYSLVNVFNVKRIYQWIQMSRQPDTNGISG
ncbi:hypothetical protein LXM25_26250 [Dyadobacter sp. LJ53]|nr:hypothetical protein [Dyadobacter chenwenxiniae]MCF0053602.1 hypothetical protein [Dyadobacter chenwenxiniae]